MKASPMTMRIAELRMRSEPTIGPTVFTWRVVAAPNEVTSALRRSSSLVPAMTGAGLPVAPGEAAGVAVAEDEELADADAAADPDAAGEGIWIGADVAWGSRSIGFVRISSTFPPSDFTVASGWPSATSRACTWAAVGLLANVTCQTVPPVKSMVGFRPPIRMKMSPGTVISALNRKYQRFLPTMSYIGQRST